MARQFPQVSRNQIKRIIKAGLVSNYDTDEVYIDRSKQVKKGEHIRVESLVDEESQPQTWNHELQVVHEDDNLLAVNKPAGMNVHPTRYGDTHSLLNAVAYHLGGRKSNKYVRLLNRLDTPTSGLVLLSKRPQATKLLTELQLNRKLAKYYVAVTEQPLEQVRIKVPLGYDKRQKRMRAARSGKYAETMVIESEPFANGALNRLQLVTGRKHQLRVHLAYLGAPIVGDKLYDGAAHDRLLLHAIQIVIPECELYPQGLEIHSQLPPDFIEYVEVDGVA